MTAVPADDVFALVGGLRTGAAATIPHISPFDGATNYRIAETPAEVIAQCLDLATECHRRGDWRLMSLARRRAVFEQWACLVERDAELIASFDHADMGKPLSQARSDAAAAAHILRAQPWYLELAEGSFLTANPDSLSWCAYMPVGVVAAVTPWNYPSINCVWKIAPALAAGNCVVLKPSEIASRSALHIVALALEAGFPENALHCLPGSGAGTGAGLLGASGIDMVTFTGSSATGRRIAAACAPFLRPAILECGGKSPQIVMADMSDDIDRIVPHLLDSAFANAGQLCVAKTRLLVHRSLLAKVEEGLAAAVGQYWAGGREQPDAPFGPLATRRQYEDAASTLAILEQAGGRVLLGPEPAHAPRGNFHRAAIVLDAKPATPGWREELFAPVLHVGSFETDEQAITLANDTAYGLSACVWTRDTRTALAFSREITCGEITVQGRIPLPEDGPPPHYAYSPAKASGHGVEGGIVGLKAYCQARSVTVVP